VIWCAAALILAGTARAARFSTVARPVAATAT